MKNHKRTPASYIRKFLPSLRRVSTPEGRKWTVDGEALFVSLQEVINAYGHRSQDLAEKLKDQTIKTNVDVVEEANNG